MSFIDYNNTVYDILLGILGRKPTKTEMLEVEDIPTLRYHQQCILEKDFTRGPGHKRSTFFYWLKKISIPLMKSGIYVDTNPESFTRSTAESIMALDHEQYIFTTIQTMEYFELTGKIILYHNLTAAGRDIVLNFIGTHTEWDGSPENIICLDLNKF